MGVFSSSSQWRTWYRVTPRGKKHTHKIFSKRPRLAKNFLESSSSSRPPDVHCEEIQCPNIIYQGFIGPPQVWSHPDPMKGRRAQRPGSVSHVLSWLTQHMAFLSSQQLCLSQCLISQFTDPHRTARQASAPAEKEWKIFKNEDGKAAEEHFND